MKHRRILLDGSSSCRCSTTSHGDQKTTGKNASQMRNSLLYLQEDLEQDNGHSSDLDLRKWSSVSEDIPQGEWDRIAEQMMLTFAESGHPVFRATKVHCPEKCSKAKAVENCRCTIVPIRKHYNCFSHNCFCKSAQSLRSSRRNV